VVGGSGRWGPGRQVARARKLTSSGIHVTSFTKQSKCACTFAPQNPGDGDAIGQRLLVQMAHHSPHRQRMQAHMQGHPMLHGLQLGPTRRCAAGTDQLQQDPAHTGTVRVDVPTDGCVESVETFTWYRAEVSFCTSLTRMLIPRSPSALKACSSEVSSPM
jgi:hypothetical protein